MLAAIAGTSAAHFASAGLLGANPGFGRIDPHPERNALEDLTQLPLPQGRKRQWAKTVCQPVLHCVT
jgi:hypothetical protein